MASPPAPWLSYFLVARALRRTGVFIGMDYLSLPLVGSEDAFVPVRPSRRVVPLQSGARFVREDRARPEDIPSNLPIVLLTEGQAASQLSDMASRIGRSPDVVLHRGDTCPLNGFRQVMPDLFVNQQVNGFILDLTTQSENFETDDGYDLLQNDLVHTPLLRYVVFDIDGSAWLELSPVPLVRDLDEIMAKKLVLRGMVDLNRWRPVTVRIPVFGLKAPNISIRFAGKSESCSIGYCGSDGQTAPSAQRQSGDTINLRVRQARGLRTFVDLQVTGHSASIDQICVQLPSATTGHEDQQTDALDQFADPLNQFG